MKRFFLFSAIIMALSFTATFADGGKGQNDEILRKSRISEPPDFGPVPTTFPMPFNALSQQNSPRQAAISTGYFFVDSEERLPEFWRPIPERADPFNDQPQLWRRIIPGPSILPKEYWTDPNNSDGFHFFRNPQSFRNSIDGMGWLTSDSTDDAIAGPMPLGISGGFFFNGLRYDSFYVSTNGVISLTNRRYFYDKDGNRVVPEGSANAYDPNWMGWFIGDPTKIDDTWHRDVERDNQGNPIIDPQTGSYIMTSGIADQTPDNFGYYVATLGQDPFFNPENPDMTNSTGGQLDSLGGIRRRPGFTGNPYNGKNPTNLSTIIPENRKSALIAFAWGDMHLSQYNNDEEEPEDFGQAWFKRSLDGTRLKIAFFNLSPKGFATEGTINDVAFGTFAAPENNRPGPGNYFISMDANIILDRTDSSVTINYTYVGDVSPRGSSGGDIFRRNSIAGVKGYARHTNFGQAGGEAQPGSYYYPWATPTQGGEYMQYTHYFAAYTYRPEEYPFPLSAVKFKQWQNTVRVAAIEYLVRDPKPDSPSGLDFVVPVKADEVIDYELLAGEPAIGALQPVALIQNLTNDVQGPNGVNFVLQDLNFRARFRVQNQITGRIIYNRIVPINNNCLSLKGELIEYEGEEVLDWFDCNGDPTVRVRLATSVKTAGTSVEANGLYSGEDFDASGFNGVPPYYYVQVRFPAFEPNQFIDNHIGRHRAFIIADPSDPVNGQYQGDEWPFDDSIFVNLFVLRRIDGRKGQEGFQDDVTQWHVDNRIGEDSGPVRIPSALKWVNINGEAVQEDISLYPLAPRGVYFAHNPDPEPGQPPYFETARLNSPAIKLNRKTLDGGEPINKYKDARGKGGDELRSFPIDLRFQYGASISFALQRTQLINQGNVARGWSDVSLVGPEPRVIRNGSIFTLHTYPASRADELVMEFAKPSDDGISGITNIKPENWRHHPGRKGTDLKTITDMAALTVYGGGGFLRGFLENDRDSALTHPDNLQPLERLDGRLEYGFDEFDDGIDFNFKKYFVAIPDTFINWKNQGAKNFRFRFRVLATNHIYDPPFPDDDDDFIIDNIQIITSPEAPDLEVLSVKPQFPYAMIPASQATDIPLTVQISNNANIDASTFTVKVNIYRLTDPDRGITEDAPIYCRAETISNLTSLKELNIPMPSWNARKSQRQEDLIGHYRIQAIVSQQEPDYEPLNDTNYTDIRIVMSTVFAYDNVGEYFDPFLGVLFEGESVINSVPEDIELSGAGLNLFGRNWAGSAGAQQIDFLLDRSGFRTGYGSGEISMKFTLNNPDTLRGYQAYFASLNASPEWIQFRLLDDNGQLPGQNEIANSKIIAQRMRFYINGEIQDDLFPNMYVTYVLDEPIPLPRGAYWVAISQLNQTGLELGASSDRMGMRVLNWFQNPTNGVWGESGNVLLLDKQFRTEINNKLFNQNFFAYSNLVQSGGWVPFTPPIGNPAFGRWNHNGMIPPIAMSPIYTLSTGSFIPMLRPWFGPKAHGEAADEFEWCPDDIPVEMINFAGEVRKGGIDLTWETASEENNYGFEVERRINGEDENAWSKISFVNGNGNSNRLIRYNSFDKEVTPGSTYDYRIKQIDMDGTVSCASSNIVTLTYNLVGELELFQNTPNPVVNSTNISFKLPQSEVVRLEVLDVYGNVVSTLIDNETLGAMTHNRQWDGTSNSGTKLSSGTYIYRLTAGDQTRTSKMTLVK